MSYGIAAFRALRFSPPALAALFCIAACWEDPVEPGADAGSGGAPATGGTVGSTGGSAGTGGAPATGGISGTGGVSATGGISSADGAAPSGDGGISDPDGGSAAGGTTGDDGGATVETGGSPGTGGTPGTGGAPTRTGCADPENPSTCGNGIIEPGEQCEGQDLGGVTCVDIDPKFDGGALKCLEDNCRWDTSECITNETCGNGVVDPGEDCEPLIFNYGPYQFCSDYLPESNGALVACSASTCKYDFSLCAGQPTPVCGNGIRESDELCDGDDWLYRSCLESPIEYVWGSLACNQETCKFNYSQCERCDGTRCGDGIVQQPYEECDGPPTQTCADVNRLFGQVTCSPWCSNNTSQCTGGCTVTPYGLICS